MSGNMSGSMSGRISGSMSGTISGRMSGRISIYPATTMLHCSTMPVNTKLYFRLGNEDEAINNLTKDDFSGEDNEVIGFSN